MVKQSVIPINSFSPNEKHDMDTAILKLIHLGAISECSPIRDQFISKIFLAPKSNGDKRFILNLKSLNKFISKSHFKMEDHRTAAKLIPKNGYMATIDLKEAYLLIPINRDDRKYLRFQIESQKGLLTYEFTAMPYGLSVAPRVFTKIMKEVISHLRSRGFRSVIYLDDILCIDDSYGDCVNNVNETLRLLQCLGFVINSVKSSLEPKQVCKFLGFNFDSRNLSLMLPDDKRKKIAQLVQKFSYLPRCSIREFSQLTGVLVAACPAVKYGWLYTKTLERQKFLALLENNNDYDAKIKPSNLILEDLYWWATNIHSTYSPMRYSHFEHEIYTDASGTGWGAVCGNNRTNGRWKVDEIDLHINYLELQAVFLGLKSFAQQITNCAILLRVDNTTAISYVNRMGGIQFPHLNNLSRLIWQWCEERNVWIFASYVNTKENIADSESRIINPDTEWELSDTAFQTIVGRFGQPEIDLFASRANAKCENYVSWKPDPDAVIVDAFTISWRKTYFYAFPPFSVMLKCLRKIIDDQANGILVFPDWPSQPWYPLLQSLLASEILYFRPNKSLLNSRFREQHPMHANLTLGVARLCSNPSADEVLHRTQ